jgi:hypothetical protein
MVWEPLLIALALGLLISLALHFILVWPSRAVLPKSPDAAGTPDKLGDQPGA